MIILDVMAHLGATAAQRIFAGSCPSLGFARRRGQKELWRKCAMQGISAQVNVSDVLKISEGRWDGSCKIPSRQIQLPYIAVLIGVVV